MEYAAGGELLTRIVNSHKNRLPPEVAKFYAGEIALALAYIHSRSIILRDLKVTLLFTIF